MRSLLLTSAATLVFLAADAGAFPIAAARPRATLSCPRPTARQCRDPAYLRTRCGKIQAARARTDANAPCALTITRELERRPPPPVGQVKAVLQPAVMTNAVGAVVPPDGPETTDTCTATRPRSACAEVEPPSSFGMSVTGDSQVAFARTWKNVAFLPPSNTAVVGLNGKALLANSRQQYAQNGVRVETCGEYVYEKYFDYTRFEEEAAAAQFDPRGLYDVAYASVGLPSSIGSRGVLGIPLRQLDGTPFESEIAFPTNQPKNDFYGHPYLHEEPSGTDPVSLPFYSVPCAGRSRVYFFETLWIEDLELYTSLLGAETHDESFAWHQQQNDALRAQGYLDEELYELDELKKEFLDKLAERRWLESVVHDYLQYIFLLGVGDEVRQIGIDVNPDAPITNPFENLAWAIAAHEVGFDAQQAGEQTALELTFASPTFAANVNPDPAAVQSYLTQQMPQALCSNVEPANFLESALIRLAIVDAGLEEILQRAQQSDCLNASGTSPCDWSPALFAQRVSNLFVEEREDDMRVCVEKTKGNIEAIRDRNLRLGSNTTDDIFTAAGTNCSERTGSTGGSLFWDANPTTAEQYFECIDAWIRATVQELIDHQGSPFDADGKLVVGKAFSTSESIGNSKVGASFSLGANFGVRGFDTITAAQEAGSLSHSVGGHLNATARLFGKGATIVDARMKTTLEEVDVDFEVGGVELYGDAPEQLYEGDLAAIIDGDSRTINFIDSSTTVLVGPIPVTVHGQVTGEVGITYAVSAIQPPAILNRELVATYEPYTRVDAFASAAVNGGIASAGIKGTINIVHVSLPYRAGTHVYVPSGTSDPAIDVFGDSSLAVRALAGRFAVFVKVGSGILSKKYEKTVTSWPGLQWNKTLWQDDYSVSVEPLLLYQAGGLPDGSP